MERFIPKHHIKLGALVGHGKFYLSQNAYQAATIFSLSTFELCHDYFTAGETGLVYSGYINDELYAIKTSKGMLIITTNIR